MLRNRKRSVRDALLLVGITVAILLWPPLLRSDDPPVGVGPARSPLPYVEWYRATFGVGIGAAGLFVADLDADGRVETVASAVAGQSYWYVLAGEGPGLAQEWVSLPYPSGIDSLRASQLDGDAALEILVGTAGAVEVFDGGSRELERRVQTVATHTYGLAAADVDSDGSIELIFSDEIDLFVVDSVTGAVEYRGIGLGGRGVAVGQVDDDPALEIVVAGASSGYVVDGQTWVLEWTRPERFGDLVRVADLDGDGREEILAGFRWYTGIVAINAETHEVAWSLPVFNLAALRVIDVDGDGSPEAVYGDAQWGKVHVLEGGSGTERWAIENPEHGVTDVAAGDVDGNGQVELLWGAGYTSSGPDHLYVADTGLPHIRWQTPDVNGPVYGLDYGDVDADGTPELLSTMMSSDSGYGDGLFFVHDALTKALEFASPPPTGKNWTGLRRIRQANVDEDPQAEILIGSGELYKGMVICYDGVSHEVQWRASVAEGLDVVSLAVGDVDADGALEVVAGTRAEHTGAPGAIVYVFEAGGGTLEWQSPPLPVGFWAPVSLLRLADVDGDGTKEIVVAAPAGPVITLSAVTKTVVWTTGELGVTALDTPDLDGNGTAETVIGTSTGALERIDPATGAVLETLATVAGPVNGLAVRDVTADGLADYVVGSGDRVVVVEGGTGEEVWRSEVLGTGVGAEDSLLVGDVDLDGRLEIVVNVGPAGFMVLERSDLAPPAVTLDAPAPNATVSGSVLLAATASDETGLAGVEFLVDGARVGFAPAAPYELVWDSASVSDGDHVVQARAWDAAGNQRLSAAAPVTVANGDVVAPEAAITSPAPGALLRATVTVAVSASDDVGVTRVELHVDGALYTWRTSPPWSFTWNTASWDSGSHTLVARALDAAGNAGLSPAVAVVTDNTAPTVSVTSPATGSIVSGVVTIAATATDNHEMAAVYFNIDGMFEGSDTAEPYTLDWDTSAVAPGSHGIFAYAVDRAGNFAVSSVVTVTIEVPGEVTATFDTALRAPRCASAGRACDSGTLLVGRGPVGPEPNQPNTIGGSCADGTVGVFHSDESMDRLKVTTVDGSPLAPGRAVRLEAAVWAWSGYGSDKLDLYYAGDAAAPQWTYLATLTPAAAGSQVLSATYVLPRGALQAVRARFRYGGAAAPCGVGSYDDHDDLAFAVAPPPPDDVPPVVSITSPPDGASVSGTVTIQASASDDYGVEEVAFYVDGDRKGADTTAPYAFSWSLAGVPAGVHTLVARARDYAGNETASPAVQVHALAPETVAVWDPALKAPRCGAVGTGCASGTLLNGRGAVGPEPNAPNTVGGSCADDSLGTYHRDESNDSIRVSTVDGSVLAAGKLVRVEAVVWAYAAFTSDKLDLYYAADASAPAWTYIVTLTPSAAGPQTLSATYTLPSGPLQAVRARFRYNGSASACGVGSYNDHDDLVFAVN